ncbi:protein-lysine palmitoyltransferase [Candidatus Ferrigenium straubiae]|jgi:cytolysin-activating lysine-acyltransferase|uniref:protein-lysine palmitoyltransferase n=1 Tax=Candidatus Ferrigenium straubiae TaxID=2919506 RepID=UPI003F4AA7BA
MNKKVSTAATDKPGQPKKNGKAKQAATEAPGQAAQNEKAPATAQPALKEAQNSLAKLPIMGPALWLYARDPMKKFMFVGDIDWAILPPVILDQCRLYTKDGIPFAFFTWALVNDAIDQRLRSGTPRIAPNEWKSGTHLWLVDVVTPFGKTEEMIDELRKAQFPGQKISALLPDPQQGNQVKLREWAPAN